MTATVVAMTAGASSSNNVGQDASAVDIRLAAALAQPLQRDDIKGLTALTRAALDVSVGPGADRESRRAIITRERLLRAIGSVLRNPRSPDLKRLEAFERDSDVALDALGGRAPRGFGRFDTSELVRLSAKRRGG